METTANPKKIIPNYQKQKKIIESDQTDSEKVFLEGPRSRFREFIFAVKVLIEFISGFRALHFLGQ
jgi:hypothetical protein